MIKSGRNLRDIPQKNSTDGTRAARLTAILGTLVFALFLCFSVNDSTGSRDVSVTFGEGAYQVFAPADAPIDEEASAVEDGSVWAYLESVIARLIYGE